MEENTTNETDSTKQSNFKKPVLIGKIGRLPRKVEKPANPIVKEVKDDNVDEVIENKTDETITQDQQVSTSKVTLPYKEPAWSGLPQSPNKNYGFEVLKSGSIIGNVDLMEKPFYVFGRMESCDIYMAHPTISRYHAVLQYRSEESEEQPKGFYLYDLSSTHGTFLNKMKLKPRLYVRVQVGHIIRLGCSTRNYILTGPEEDAEKPSELSVTELKQLRAQQILDREREREEAALKAEEEAEQKRKKEEERGVDWGMGEDADEETDLTENPYAATNNEELYLDDPKKALRGFMEREGYDLEYDCSEQGIGQFVCKVELPIDDDRGRPIVAEVVHKGKKKEAVVQCALEACRILDRHGLLRQATHESRKRKVKNWEENDFYDSDDDTFLDRTGTIEKKREIRMKAKLPQQPETYQSLSEKAQNLSTEIADIQRKLQASKAAAEKSSAENEDSLDAYMSALKQPKLDKDKVTKLKTDLHRLKQEYANVSKLLDIARPADLPPLVQQNSPQSTPAKEKSKLPIFGKRLKVKVQKPIRKELESFQDESDEDEINQETMHEERIESDMMLCLSLLPEQLRDGAEAIWKIINTFSEDENLDKGFKVLDSLSGKCDPHFLVKTKKLLKDLLTDKPKSRIKEEFVALGQEIVEEIKLEEKTNPNTTDKVGEISEKPMEDSSSTKESSKDDEVSAEEQMKRRKKNQRRIQQRQGKTEVEKIKGYEEDAMKEDYNMWVPPAGQTGDGKTSLNEKFGY